MTSNNTRDTIGVDKLNFLLSVTTFRCMIDLYDPSYDPLLSLIKW
jgi:hypothetical protein